MFEHTEKDINEHDHYNLTKIRMPLTYKVAQKNFLSPIQSKILIGLPLTFETLCIIDAIKDKVPNLMVIPQSSGKNSSTQLGVFKYLDMWGINYFKNADEHSRIKALQNKPDIIIDCSFMLGECGFKNNLIDPNTILIEDTKTGENRLNELNRHLPINNSYIILDNSNYKKDYENNVGIGYSVVGALISMGFFMPLYKIGVIGYGPVGQGVARYLLKLGATVYICETDPLRQRNASKIFNILEIDDLLKKVDIVITATGTNNVITKDHIKNLNKKLILVNAGGEDEWDSTIMFDGLSGKPIHGNICEYIVEMCTIWEVGGGNSVNLVGRVSVSEFLDITFSFLINILSHIPKVHLSKGKNETDIFDNNDFKNLVEKAYPMQAENVISELV